MTPELIAGQFLPELHHAKLATIGDGLINDTYCVTSGNKRFILQKINANVFPKPEQLIENHLKLISHVETHQYQNIKLRIPKLYSSKNNQPYYIDKHRQYWRLTEFIENTFSCETLISKHHAEQTGSILGRFHATFDQLDINSLHDTLPGFHITPNYLKQYHQIAFPDNTDPLLDENHQFIINFQTQVDVLEKAKTSGIIQERVIHGDPKLNNILFDINSGNAVSLIDLDTVKPGLPHYDLGDCLRSCCNIGSDEQQLTDFELDICEAIMKEYVRAAGPILNDNDFRYFYDAIVLIPFELGLRFCIDYLSGNTYFKVDYPEQNLHRARCQFGLVDSIKRQQKRLNQLINDCRRIS